MLLVVGRSIEQREDRGGVAHFEFHQPALSAWIGIDYRWILRDLVVDSNDLARACGVDVARDLHALDFAHGGARGYRGAHGLHPDIGDVGELVSGVLSDADGDG